VHLRTAEMNGLPAAQQHTGRIELPVAANSSGPDRRDGVGRIAVQRDRGQTGGPDLQGDLADQAQAKPPSFFFLFPPFSFFSFSSMVQRATTARSPDRLLLTSGNSSTRRRASPPRRPAVSRSGDISVHPTGGQPAGHRHRLPPPPPLPPATLSVRTLRHRDDGRATPNPLTARRRPARSPATLSQGNCRVGAICAIPLQWPFNEDEAHRVVFEGLDPDRGVRADVPELPLLAGRPH